LIVPGRGLARSRLFRSSLVTVYGVGLVLCLLAVASAIAMPLMPSRWLVATAFAAASAVIAWRLWLYRRTYITGGRPSTRRLLLVFLPRTLLALVGLVLAMGGLGYVLISLFVAGGPGTEGSVDGPIRTVMSVIGGVMIILGGLFITPLVLALQGRRSPEEDPETRSDDAPPSQDASAT
jgi:hypothetical protein